MLYFHFSKLLTSLCVSTPAPSSLRPSECNGTKITRKKQLKIENVVKSIQEGLMPVETQPGTMKWFIDASDKCLSALEIIRWTG